MFKSNSLFKKIVLLCTALLIVILFWGGLNPKIASSQQVDSRVNNLEFDIRDIESRLNRIESQLGQPSRSASPRTPTNSPNNRGRNLQQLSREEMFDRLATLVVETKQQVNQLEARVSKLESQGSPSKKP